MMGKELIDAFENQNVVAMRIKKSGQPSRFVCKAAGRAR